MIEGYTITHVTSLRQKAEQLAVKGKQNFQATEGWFQRWIGGENIVLRKLHGESLDADVPAVDLWLKAQ